MNIEAGRNFSEIKAVATPRPQVRTDLQIARKAREAARFASTFRFAFFSPRDELQQPFPDITIKVAPLRIESPTEARKQVTSRGSAYEITINESWINRSTRWEMAEVVLHQMLLTAYAAWFNENVRTLNSYHIQPVVDMAEELGLHLKQRKGSHARPADGQFARLMDMLGVPKPNHDVGDLSLNGKTKGIKHWWDSGKEPVKGNSTLKKFVCGCDNIRHGGTDLEAACLKCRQVYRPEDSKELPKFIDTNLKSEPERPHLNALNVLFTSKARTALLQTFYSNPENGIHVRELVRKTGLEINALRRELAKFEKIGLVSSHQDQNKKVYTLEKDSNLVIALSHLFPAKVE